MVNFIDFIAVIVTFGLPIAFIALIFIFVSIKIKSIETKLDKILKFIEAKE
ncbi:hypothetical protein ABG79_01450 [Caloramator mitchellensis]|uniref:YvrJ protein family protein n=1 Tax=Caloramator mitchellensis TaxID=908809 RepID=A0A0R3K0D2_CALMK|nr:hypothetical protein [Caloramator mitchellensis]KRQ86700.1 hypothetical protein ABG79_01450 [Caloramator mitchellensis]